MSKARRIRKIGVLVASYYDGRLGRRCVSQKFLNRAARALRRYYGDAAEQTLRRAVERIRPHASFFKWMNREKETEELGIVRILSEAVGEPLAFRKLSPGADPPDVIGEREDGTLVAIEVTELIDQRVTGRNVRAMQETTGLDPIERLKKLVYRVWEKPDLIEAIQKRLRAKDEDAEKLDRGQFVQYVIALHTDEMMLTHPETDAWLLGHTFAGMRGITDAYLLFSYDGKSYPYIRLSMSA